MILIIESEVKMNIEVFDYLYKYSLFEMLLGVKNDTATIISCEQTNAYILNI